MAFLNNIQQLISVIILTPTLLSKLKTNTANARSLNHLPIQASCPLRHTLRVHYLNSASNFTFTFQNANSKDANAR